LSAKELADGYCAMNKPCYRGDILLERENTIRIMLGYKPINAYGFDDDEWQAMIDYFDSMSDGEEEERHDNM